MFCGGDRGNKRMPLVWFYSTISFASGLITVDPLHSSVFTQALQGPVHSPIKCNCDQTFGTSYNAINKSLGLFDSCIKLFCPAPLT